MDSRKTGEFISQVRKKNNMTQKELARRLYISDKTVSRWETGKGYPDIEILPLLSKVLGVSINELLAGEYIESKEETSESDKNILRLCKGAGNKKYMRNLRLALAMLCVCAGTFISANAGASHNKYYLIFSYVLMAIGVIFSVLVFLANFFKYSGRELSNEIITVCEIAGSISFVLFYRFVYFKFNSPGTVDFVFILCSTIFILPIIIDISLNEIKKS